MTHRGPITFSITGQEATVTTENGTINYIYDKATGLLLETWTGTNHGTPQNDTLYGYDNEGRLESVTEAVVNGIAPSSITGTRYDAGGDAISTTLPTILYSYDVAGNLITEIDPNGMITAYTYNDLNELTNELVTQSIDQGTGVQHVDVFQAAYTLNDDGSRATETDTRYTPGATVIDNQTKLTWTYDNDQRLVEEQLTVLSGTDGPTPYDDQFGYDLDNSSGLTNRLWFVRAAIRTRRRENPPYRRLDRRW